MSIRRVGGKSPSLEEGCYVDPDALLIGDVVVRKMASIWPCALLRADDERVDIGEGSAVMDMAFAEAPSGHPVNVKEGCIVSHGARLHGCTIERGCLVGVGAIVLDGARIGEGSVVAAGGVVTPGTHVRPGTVVAGVPAKVVRETSESEAEFIVRELKNLASKADRYRTQ